MMLVKVKENHHYKYMDVDLFTNQYILEYLSIQLNFKNYKRIYI